MLPSVPYPMRPEIICIPIASVYWRIVIELLAIPF